MLAAGSAVASAGFPRVDRFGCRISRILLTTRQILEKYPREGYRNLVTIH